MKMGVLTALLALFRWPWSFAGICDPVDGE